MFAKQRLSERIQWFDSIRLRQFNKTMSKTQEKEYDVNVVLSLIRDTQPNLYLSESRIPGMYRAERYSWTPQGIRGWVYEDYTAKDVINLGKTLGVI